MKEREVEKSEKDEKNEMRIEIKETSSTMRDVNGSNNDHEDFRKAMFLKNRRKNPKYRNSVMGIKMFTSADFQIIKKIGKGKYGKVYLVKEKSTNYLLAMKMIEKSHRQKRREQDTERDGKNTEKDTNK